MSSWKRIKVLLKRGGYVWIAITFGNGLAISLIKWGDYYWSEKYYWECYHPNCKGSYLSNTFYIAPFDGDWKDSLIKVEHKEKE